MGKFQGYRTIANVSPITDAPNYRIICDDYSGMMDAIIGAHDIAGSSTYRNGRDPMVNWVIAQVLTTPRLEGVARWVTVEVIALSIDGSKIMQITSNRDPWFTGGIDFNLDINAEDYGPQLPSENYILARTVDGEWQRVDLDNTNNPDAPQLPGCIETINTDIGQVSAYAPQMPAAFEVIDSYVAPSVDLVNGQLETYAEYTDRIRSDDICMDTVSAYAIQRDIVATVAEFFGQHNADKAVIAWRELPTGDMAWIIDLPSGEQYRWDNGFIVRLSSRAKLTNNQVSELLLQLDSFVSVVNSAFDSGDWNRAEQASLYAMGISKLLG